jgi:hypothetical protein
MSHQHSESIFTNLQPASIAYPPTVHDYDPRAIIGDVQLRRRRSYAVTKQVASQKIDKPDGLEFGRSDRYRE